VAKNSLQDQYAPNSICFGCGPANKKGLQIKSFSQGKQVVAKWTPESHHEAFPGILNGGIIGSLLDCHSNWTAASHLMNKHKMSSPPCTVTADYSVQLLQPTPSNQSVRLVSIVKNSTERKVLVEAKLFSGEDLCAKCQGTFVAVKPGHPAYHRWS